jgi:fructose-1,6-bisphosphatase I
MEEIFEAIKISAIKIQETITVGDTSKSDNQNTSGDTQLKLDVQSDIIIEDEFKKIDSIKSIMSEEKDDELHINDGGTYLVAYDPLDGSSLVDVNLSVGSIFGIYKDSYCGENLIASAYVVYGPRVELVIADKDVKFYRLNNGEFKYIDTLSLDNKGKLNAPGGTQKNWLPHHKKLVDDIFASGYRLRYSGGMVPDLHQILLKKGGLFSYPATSDAPKGKLRMNFEVFPFALVYELAGGSAINDKGERLLSLTPTKLHDTTPCFFGSNEEIKLVKEAYNV